MKILLVADREEKALWDFWTQKTAERLSDVSLILSAGDLSASYLEFLVTMLNVPLVYVRGNHDGAYDKRPPEGCIDADGRIVEVRCGGRTSGERLRIMGLGGSMRYKKGAPDMYTEGEMTLRLAGLSRVFIMNKLTGRSGFDILLTHAPCKGYGDMEDLPHQGFACFNEVLNRNHPALHCYGHVHKEYSAGFERKIIHPSGTTLINACGYYIYDL